MNFKNSVISAQSNLFISLLQIKYPFVLLERN